MPTRLFIVAMAAAATLWGTSCKKCACECPAPATPVPETNYRPSTAGSTWTYQPSQGAPVTLTATNRDTMIGSRSYRVISNTGGTSNYWLKSGTEYYSFGTIPGMTGSGFENLYLKHDQPVDATWKVIQPVTIPGLPLPLNAELNYKIKAKNASRQVSGKTFTEVIHVRLDIVLPSPLGAVGGGDYYYANRIGLVESNFQLQLVGQPTPAQTQILTAYTIK